MSKGLIIRVVIVLVVGIAVNESTRLHEYGHFLTAGYFGASPVMGSNSTQHVYTHNPIQESLISKSGMMLSFYVVFILALVELSVYRLNSVIHLPVFVCIAPMKVFDVVDYLNNGANWLNLDDLNNIAYFEGISRKAAAVGMIEEILIMSALLILLTVILYKHISD